MAYPLMYGIEENQLLISELYHENSKLRRFEAEREENELKEHAAEIHEFFSHPFKSYPGAEKTKLTMSSFDSRFQFDRLIKERRTVREFVDVPMNIDELSTLLSLSTGITDRKTMTDGRTLFYRAYPSAGALYPLEIYPVATNVEGLKRGVYHYNVKEHAVELIKEGEHRDILYKNCLYQDFIYRASVLFLIAAIFLRTRSKYGERGYRYVFLDAGHLGENIYLTATAMQLGPVAIGGFIDDAVNELVNLDGVEESVIYIIAVGKVKQA